MDRKALAAIAGLSLVSVAAMFGSVMTALASFDEQEVQYSTIDISEGLLSPEPVDAVRIKPPTPDLVAAISESPVPSLAPPKKSPPKEATPPQVVAKTPRFEISIASAARGRGGNRTISYDVTIRNVGEVSLAGLVVRSHVPSGTSWPTSPSCDRNGHEVTLTYPDTKERLCIAGSQTILGNSETHPVEATLRALTPGMTVVVSYAVDVSAQSGAVSNHAHLSGAGIEMQTASTADSATAGQSSATSTK